MTSPTSDGTSTPTGRSTTPTPTSTPLYSTVAAGGGGSNNNLASSGGGSGSTGSTGSSFAHSLRHASTFSVASAQTQTYANRAASAIKASGFAQRFGKAIYGSTSPAASSVSPTPGRVAIEPLVETDLKFTAKSGVAAMAISSDRTQAAVAGKDFFQVLNVGEEINVEKDMRQSRETRDFDKIFAVTDIKWGYQLYNSHIALATSGGSILLYDLNNAAPRGAVTEYKDNNRYINTIGFSQHTGHMLFSGTNDGTVKVWDLRTSTKKASLQFSRPGDNTRELQVSPFSSNKFAVIYDSGVIQRWDLRNTKTFDKRINAHASFGLSLDWHPEYDYIVSGGRDKLIQVWNMSRESRDADYVILSPGPVSTVRWQVDNNSVAHGRNAASGVLSTAIASCTRNKFDYKAYIWNLRRPAIPVNVLEHHSDSISEIQWRSDRLLWTASRDCTFRQHDLSTEELVIDNLSSRALSWSPFGELTFAVQDKYRDQFGSMQSYRLAEDGSTPDATASNHGSSSRRATSAGASGTSRKYGSFTSRLHSRPIQDIEYNQALCGISLNDFDFDTFSYYAENYIIFPGSGLSLPEICDVNARVAMECEHFRTAQTWKIIKSAMQWEQERYVQYKEDLRLKKPAVDHLHAFSRNTTSSRPAMTFKKTNNFSSKSSDGKRGLKLSLSGTSRMSSLDKHVKGLDSSPSTPLPISTGVELGEDDEEDENDSDSNVPSSRSSSTMRPVPVPESDHRPSMLSNEISSSQSYDDDFAPLSSFGSQASASTEDGVGISESAIIEEGEPLSGLGISTKKIDEHSKYQQFLKTLDHPWTTSNLLIHAADYAMNQGDVQFCTALSILFCRFYPAAFPDSAVMEEWSLSYVELLRRCGLFTAAAEIIKSSSFETVRTLGLTDTTMATLCHRCMAPLSENVAPAAYWYCDSCKKLLDGCAVCREPVKGLATGLITCGHKIHISCMKEWVVKQGMIECPSGCGAVLIV